MYSLPYDREEYDTPRSAIGHVARWGSVAAGTALIAYGLSRRNRNGAWFAVAATPLVYRGLMGQWPVYSHSSRSRTDTRTALGGDRGARVHEAVRIDRPAHEVYRYWRRLQNLPQFMSYVDEVVDLGAGRSHWVARGPAGTTFEWDAEIINEIENRLIAWRSLPESDVQTAGSVTFEPVRNGEETQVSVRLQMSPPSGRVSSMVATLLGRSPSGTVREDLRRLKQLLEAGEIPVARPEDAAPALQEQMR